MPKLTPELIERAKRMHAECMEDAEYAAKWNALVAQVPGLILNIPGEALEKLETDEPAVSSSNGERE